MDDSEDFVAFVGFILVAAAIAWLFLPRTYAFSDDIMVYSFEAENCNQAFVCSGVKLFPAVKLRVDASKSEVVWLNSFDGTLGKWEGCTISDKKSWRCTMPEIMMSGGYVQSKNPKFHYTMGFVYRIYWLLSFFDKSGVQSY